MLSLLKLLQRISRIRRRAFGKTTPHWFKDGLLLFGFVNVFDLLPTLLAIMLSPRHFYRRLPQYVQSNNIWFKTPLKFFTSGVTLIVALLFFLSPGCSFYDRSPGPETNWLLRRVDMLNSFTDVANSLSYPSRFFGVYICSYRAPPCQSIFELISSFFYRHSRIYVYITKNFLGRCSISGTYFYITLQVLQLIGIY